jgi:hypothetical protein
MAEAQWQAIRPLLPIPARVRHRQGAHGSETITA